MNAQYIDYESTRCFSSAIVRYLNNEYNLRPFINEFPSIEGFRKIIAQKQHTTNRQILSQELTNQYQSLENIPSLVQSNINLLTKENTFTVTTGHQLNIFTGPLYFIFKIVTAINLAAELKIQFPDKNFVPVYWMASEDHDFEEINHTHIGGKKIFWQQKSSGATGRLKIESIKDALKEYEGVLGIGKNAEKLASIVNAAYTENTTLANATRQLVNDLFKDYGLVIINADSIKFKKQFAEIVKRDIIEQNSFKNIQQTDTALSAENIKSQVFAREINFFYLVDNLRERIIFENNLYKILNTDISFTQEKLIEEIDQYPDRFSPNVVMRPLYQEVILPNVAYIGGGAEVVYWLQLKKNFDYYKIDFPAIVLRNSAMLISKKIAAKASRLGLNNSDLFEDREVLKRNYVYKKTSHNLSLKDEWREMECLFEKLKLRAHKIDATLAPSTEAIKIRLSKAMDNLEKKLLRAEKKNHNNALSDIEQIKNTLFPNNGLQERSENFGLLYVKYGDDFIKQLINHFKPLDFTFTILQE